MEEETLLIGIPVLRFIFYLMWEKWAKISSRNFLNEDMELKLWDKHRVLDSYIFCVHMLHSFLEKF